MLTKLYFTGKNVKYIGVYFFGLLSFLSVWFEQLAWLILVLGPGMLNCVSLKHQNSGRRCIIRNLLECHAGGRADLLGTCWVRS